MKLSNGDKSVNYFMVVYYLAWLLDGDLLHGVAIGLEWNPLG
jgi:hypothetical protein